MKLRTKIILIVILLSLIVNIALLTTFIFRNKKESIELLNQRIKNTSVLLNQVNAGPLYDMDLSKLKTNLQSFLSAPEIVAIDLKEHNGNINIHFEQPNFDKKSNIKKSTQIIYNNEQIGVIDTYYTLYYIDKRLDKLIWQILVSSLILIIITSITLYVFLRRITKPISDLTTLAAEIANGNLQKEIKITTSDEIGRLGKSFMKMRDSVENKIFSLKLENTERRLVEDELIKSQKRLKEAQKVAKIGDWELDLKEDKFNISDMINEIFNLEADEWDNSYEGFLNMIHPDDREKVNDAYRKSVKNKMVYNISYRILLKDNTIKFVTGISDTIYDESGEPIRSVGTVQDITTDQLAKNEKVKLEEQLAHSRKMDAIGQLAGGVAHDFNNMLCGISGAAQLLETPGMQLNKEALGYVDMILMASTRASELTSKLLAFGRKGAIASTTVDIISILNDAYALLDKTINKKVKITVINDAQDHMIIGDHAGLENIFINLCINSSHALPNGGEIKIKTKNINIDQKYCNKSQFDIQPGNYIEIKVIDNGSGIDSEVLHRIFDPFFTTKDLGNGTGLGLSAAYGTILKHNGAITVESMVGVGTTFTILFLCVESDEEIIQHSQGIVKGSGTILLVDDEDVVRTTCMRMLKYMGYDVIIAKNGKEAVELFQQNYLSLDLVLMDMMMPIMNGREAFVKMKEIDSACNVVVFSGYTQSENIDDLKNMGLDGFINKPFKDYELSQLLAKIIKSGKNSESL